MVSRGVVPVGKRSGGAELAAFKLAAHLAAHGEHVVLVSDIDPPMPVQASANLSFVTAGAYEGLGRLVRLVPMDFSRWVLQHLLGNARAARRARAVLKADREGFDAVHVHGALATILVRRAVWAGSRGTPLVYTEHDSTPWSCRYRHGLERLVRRCVYRWVNLRACRMATVVVTNFASLADELAARTGISRSRFVTIPNAVEARGIPRRGTVQSVAARHGFDRYCLFVGSLVDRKGPDILLRALAEVGLPCIFVGDGPMRASLERLASVSGIADRVIFTGALDARDLHGYYTGAEALVLPSVSEGVPLVAIEALGAGVPVIASNLAGVASVVRDRENGLLVTPGDHRSLARALIVVQTDIAMHLKLKNGALASVRTIRTWPQAAGQLRALYVRHQRPREAAAAAGSPAGPVPPGSPAANGLAFRPWPAVPQSGPVTHA
jgi:glycosyltransferase involved in cell wall biosynthesis